MKIHPDAMLLPPMTEAQYAELVEDIRKNGLHESIKVDHTGELIVDGRHRDRACPEAGCEPRYERLPEDTDILAYVVSINVHRRHLTDDQKKEIIAEVIRRNPSKSNREIAAMTKVSEPTIRRARRRSRASPDAPDQKHQGKDGKQYPASGTVDENVKAAIQRDLKAGAHTFVAIGAKHGVSKGTVAGISNRMRLDGELPPAPPRKPRRNLQAEAAIAAAERRRERGRVTDEEFERPPAELLDQQYPGREPGVTYATVHREKHGPIWYNVAERRKQCEERLMGMAANAVKVVDKPVQNLGFEDLSLTSQQRVKAAWRSAMEQICKRLGMELTDILADLTAAKPDCHH